MAYQRGSLRIVSRKGGDVWMLRYRLNTADGQRKENTLPVGLVRDFPTEKAAWREVDRLGLLIRINSEESVTRIRFNTLAEYYLKADFGEDAVRPKSVNTIPIVEHYVRDYLIARWGNELAGDIGPLEIQRWLKPHKQRTRLDHRFEDPRHHAPDLQGRNPARARREESRSARRDAVSVPLQGRCDHAITDPYYPESADESASLHSRSDLCRDGASRI